MMCGKHLHSAIDLKRLADLGLALDNLQTLSVFNGGFVGFCDETESEVIEHVAGKEGRSAARARAGRSAAERPWGASGQAHHFRSAAVEAAFGAKFRILARHYAALAFEDPNGLWVVAKSKPLGNRGPQIHFLVAFPLDNQEPVRGWAFEQIGPHAKLMSLKHTNFPDASICAFMPNDNSWSISDGLTELFDHYSIWALKKLHRDLIGTWPGKQAGVCAFYRRSEFVSSEWCGCLSGKRYKDCHQGSDMLMDEAVARAEFGKIFRCNYEARSAPASIMQAAITRWRKIPPINYLKYKIA